MAEETVTMSKWEYDHLMEAIRDVVTITTKADEFCGVCGTPRNALRRLAIAYEFIKDK